MLRPVYIVAVSGGVDSVVLLDMIASRLDKSEQQKQDSLDLRPPLYVVAHVDHGIRDDSQDDAAFVKELAKAYKLPFETVQLALGAAASEDKARAMRYEFLFEIMKKYKAEAVVTAHHQDDVIETMLVNMLRGTGPKGLVGFNYKNIVRPLLHKKKSELIDYATEHRLEWREDSTNDDSNYLRNDVRKRFMPKLGTKRKKLLEIRSQVEELYIEIDDLSKKLLIQTIEKGQIVRSRFVVLPYSVQKQVMVTWLRLADVEIDKKMIEKAVLATKTLLPGKHIELAKDVKVYSEKSSIVLKV